MSPSVPSTGTKVRSIDGAQPGHRAHLGKRGDTGAGLGGAAMSRCRPPSSGIASTASGTLQRGVGGRAGRQAAGIAQRPGADNALSSRLRAAFQPVPDFMSDLPRLVIGIRLLNWWRRNRGRVRKAQLALSESGQVLGLQITDRCQHIGRQPGRSRAGRWRAAIDITRQCRFQCPMRRPRQPPAMAAR